MKRQLPWIVVILFFLASPALADKGPIIWHEGVTITQEAQKAIILHNSTEEILILGTELKANKEVEILEFIPFPSEPKVSLVKGDPFVEAAKLIQRKGLLFRFRSRLSNKGGDGTGGTVPVEIRLSEKIGLHDVTAIKINDIDQFSKWLEEFFKGKGIRMDKDKLFNVYRNAQDYVQRGITYFVFDSVKVARNVKFVEPLVYRFKTDKIYYPLKTSNLIGGNGAVELILALPGSVTDEIWQHTIKMLPVGAGVDIKLSTSAKVQAGEIEPLYGVETFFAKASKVYLQVFKYTGPYNFKDDFTYPIGKLVPYAYRYGKYSPLPDASQFTPSLTQDEARDVREAFCAEANEINLIIANSYGLSCWGFIPNDEYEVYAALFRKGGPHGIPKRDIVLENNTIRHEYKGTHADAAIVKSFDATNKASYPLENAFPPDENLKIRLRRDAQVDPLLFKGKTSVSRAGFNKERTAALIYVEHITGPRSAVGHYVTVEKKGGEWQIAHAELGIMFGN